MRRSGVPVTVEPLKRNGIVRVVQFARLSTSMTEHFVPLLGQENPVP